MSPLRRSIVFGGPSLVGLVTKTDCRDLCTISFCCWRLGAGTHLSPISWGTNPTVMVVNYDL